MKSTQDWRGPGTLFSKWHSLSRIYFFSAFLMVAFCPLAIASPKPLEMVIVLVICCRLLYLVGKQFADSASLAMIGAIGEEEVATVLQQLPDGWKVERNIQIDSGGDIDFLLTSPASKIFLIDAKAHVGIVYFDGARLMRKLGRRSASFEKDFLSKVKQQAVQIRTSRSLGYVNSMIVFTRAQLEPSVISAPYVQVIGIADLLPVLLASEKRLRSKTPLRLLHK